MKSIQNQILSGGGYVSPVSKVVEIQPEGVLCGSGTFTTPTWGTDDETLDFN